MEESDSVAADAHARAPRMPFSPRFTAALPSAAAKSPRLQLNKALTNDPRAYRLRSRP
ncbi:hypothetical protein [Bosea sp. BK604]|uniref:hypothetical protein n=1 Tax=Bosea sp. BK604 TaxID=2512180 RepID=UPI0010DB839C|nr:hypothetical protein [Bosea sp. BK604]TCR61818.1 hypothetical protein EV560_112158 [Bosea sp. BK604]